MSFFKVIDDIIAGSGFEDIVFQSGVCSSGSLLAVLSGTPYNRAFNVHSGTFLFGSIIFVFYIIYMSDGSKLSRSHHIIIS